MRNAEIVNVEWHRLVVVVPVAKFQFALAGLNSASPSTETISRAGDNLSVTTEHELSAFFLLRPLQSTWLSICRIRNNMAQSFPPLRSQPSRPIPADSALTHLSNYIAAANTTAHLLPNATLQTTGPVAQGNASSNLTMQHLGRVEAGLRGEWLAPVLDFGEQGESFVDTAPAEGGQHKKFDDDAEAGGPEMGTEGWQDLAEYQREQSIEENDPDAPSGVPVQGEDIVPVEVGGSEEVKGEEPKEREHKKVKKEKTDKKQKKVKKEKA